MKQKICFYWISKIYFLGYGAPDLYGQDLTSMVNRSKRKNIKKNNPTATPTPEKNLVKPRYEVTTYKPQFVIPANFDHLHNNGGKDTKDKVNPYAQQCHTKGQLISKGLFGVFNSPKNEWRMSAPVG